MIRRLYLLYTVRPRLYCSRNTIFYFFLFFFLCPSEAACGPSANPCSPMAAPQQGSSYSPLWRPVSIRPHVSVIERGLCRSETFARSNLDRGYPVSSYSFFFLLPFFLTQSFFFFFNTLLIKSRASQDLTFTPTESKRRKPVVIVIYNVKEVNRQHYGWQIGKRMGTKREEKKDRSK